MMFWNAVTADESGRQDDLKKPIIRPIRGWVTNAYFSFEPISIGYALRGNMV